METCRSLPHPDCAPAVWGEGSAAEDAAHSVVGSSVGLADCCTSSCRSPQELLQHWPMPQRCELLHGVTLACWSWRAGQRQRTRLWPSAAPGGSQPRGPRPPGAAQVPCSELQGWGHAPPPSMGLGLWRSPGCSGGLGRAAGGPEERSRGVPGRGRLRWWVLYRGVYNKVTALRESRLCLRRARARSRYPRGGGGRPLPAVGGLSCGRGPAGGALTSTHVERCGGAHGTWRGRSRGPAAVAAGECGTGPVLRPPPPNPPSSLRRRPPARPRAVTTPSCACRDRAAEPGPAPPRGPLTGARLGERGLPAVLRAAPQRPPAPGRTGPAPRCHRPARGLPALRGPSRRGGPSRTRRGRRSPGRAPALPRFAAAPGRATPGSRGIKRNATLLPAALSAGRGVHRHRAGCDRRALRSLPWGGAGQARRDPRRLRASSRACAATGRCAAGRGAVTRNAVTEPLTGQRCRPGRPVRPVPRQECRS